ncbi:FAD-dependent monooxygenase [Streptosporangium sp. NPDC002544]|uniref:FAD-dependent monooxygenase n=1 Tax=Streptosporangium sp. NPDC002544 TaxID=3154538 RepID=UPI003319494B
MRIAIIGGGLGGLAAALLLRQAGVEAVVYEQTAELREVGAGIVVGPNMVRPLARAGLGERLASFAVPLEAAWEFRRWQDGRVLFSQPMGEECRRLYGADCYVAHRADLLEMLLEALPSDAVRAGRRLETLRQDGSEVELVFTDSRGEKTTVTADGVIGADGIHSAVRPTVVEEAPPRFSGLCAYRCLVEAEHAPELALRRVQTLWLGPGRHFVHYPIRDRKLINIVAIVPAGDWRVESWTAEGRIEDLAREFETWDPRLRQLVASATETRRWALYDRTPLERWTSGRVALLGDAAHSMLPFLGQGAAQAVEDAVVLASCLRAATRETVAQALARYAEIRRPRASQVQLMSRGREVQNHLPDGPAQLERDAAFAGGDPLRQNAWLYGHDPETIMAG